jgi:DNA ligase-1
MINVQEYLEAAVKAQGHTILWRTGTLEGETSKAMPTGEPARKYWEGFLVKDHDTGRVSTLSAACSETNHGMSSPLVSAPTFSLPKNVGKANETTCEQQGTSELQGDYKKKCDKGYRQLGTVEDGSRLLSAMLARPYADNKHRIKYPLWVQPKYDGVRALSDTNVLWSRVGILFPKETTQHIVDNLQSAAWKDISRRPILDGECILPEGYLLQHTVSAVKSFKPDLSPLLVYRLYDLFIPEEPHAPYSVRRALLEYLFDSGNLPGCLLTPQVRVDNEEQMLAMHEQYVAEGWEGIMLRDPAGVYEPGKRSIGLQKHKDFQEQEFEIVGVIEGEGRLYGHAGKFTCLLPNGNTFEAAPKRSQAEKKYFFEHPETVVGRQWTIRFQAWTEAGMPQFPRAICERVQDIQG